MSAIEQNLTKLGLILPPPPKPTATYVPYTISGNLIYVSGQLPLVEGAPQYIGKVGETFSTEIAQEAARICVLNIVSVLKLATGGNLDQITKCIRLGGFVNATPNFTEHSKVLNGASELIIQVMGEAGRHARAAVGCGSLPLGVAVEVEGIFERTL